MYSLLDFEEPVQYLIKHRKEIKNLLIVPISFVSEHVETLVELDIEYKELAESYKIKFFKNIEFLIIKKNLLYYLKCNFILIVLNLFFKS